MTMTDLCGCRRALSRPSTLPMLLALKIAIERPLLAGVLGLAALTASSAADQRVRARGAIQCARCAHGRTLHALVDEAPQPGTTRATSTGRCCAPRNGRRRGCRRP